MSIRYVCKNCGYVLFDVKNKRLHGAPVGLLSPSEVIKYYNGRCPRCGRRLEKPDLKDIVIREKK